MIAQKITALVVLFLMTTVGVFAGLSQSQFQLAPNTNQPDYQRQSKQSLERKTQNYTLFYSQAFLNTKNTQVVVPFAPADSQLPILFLGFEPKEGVNRTERLVSHPQIMNLQWPTISSGELTLYQKQPKYSTVAEFIDNPPVISSFVVDPTLKDLYPQFQGSQATDDLIDTNVSSFILTTFLPTPVDSQVYYYQATVDASDAKLNVNNEIEWYLRAPQASEDNPYFLGRIFINYQ